VTCFYTRSASTGLKRFALFLCLYFCCTFYALRRIVFIINIWNYESTQTFRHCSLDGGSAHRKASTCTGEPTQKKKANIHAWSGIRTHDHSVRKAQAATGTCMFVFFNTQTYSYLSCTHHICFNLSPYKFHLSYSSGSSGLVIRPKQYKEEYSYLTYKIVLLLPLANYVWSHVGITNGR
jgi:hypothetical protein